jgi:CubicO group peptidase (beta-lactamase class C family)
MPISAVKLLVFAVSASLAASCAASPTAPPPTATLPPAPTATTVPATATPIPDLGEAMDAQVSNLAEQGLFSGAVLVARDGEIILSQGYGLADREQGLANTAETKFRLGSVTQQFTAMAILILEQQGKVDVQASVCNYIPDCPAEWEPMTLHHLLSFTAGLNDKLGMTNAFADTTSPVEDAVLLFRDDPLGSPPGMHFYPVRIEDYVVLAYVIEQVSGQTYEAFLRQNIFEPLGMTSSGWLENGDGLALRYNGSSSVGAVSTPNDAAYWNGGGGLFSTVEDLYRWDQALYTETLVPQSALDRMFSVYGEVMSVKQGYGWIISARSGHPVYWMEGHMPGVSTVIKRYVDEDLFITVLANQGDVDAASVAAMLVKTSEPAAQ